MSGLFGSKLESKQNELRDILLIKLAARPRSESSLVSDHRATYGTGTVRRVIDQLVRSGHVSRAGGQVELTRKGKTLNAIR